MPARNVARKRKKSSVSIAYAAEVAFNGAQYRGLCCIIIWAPIRERRKRERAQGVSWREPTGVVALRKVSEVNKSW